MLSLPTIPLQTSPSFHISLGLSELQAALPTPPDPQEILSALSRRSMHALQPLLSQEQTPAPGTAAANVKSLLFSPERGAQAGAATLLLQMLLPPRSPQRDSCTQQQNPNAAHHRK